MAKPLRVVYKAWNREDLIWAAGFYDGEGSCCIVKTSRTPARPGFAGRQHLGLNLQVAQIEPTVLHRFLAAVQVGKVYGPYPSSQKGHQNYWQWQTGTFESIQYVICQLWPWLSAPKKLQARTALLAYVAYCAQPRCPMGPRPKGKPGNV